MEVGDARQLAGSQRMPGIPDRKRSPTATTQTDRHIVLIEVHRMLNSAVGGSWK